MTDLAGPVRRYGRARSSERAARLDLYEHIIQAAAAGMSMREIARLVGMSRQRVHQIIREGGDRRER